MVEGDERVAGVEEDGVELGAAEREHETRDVSRRPTPSQQRWSALA